MFIGIVEKNTDNTKKFNRKKKYGKRVTEKRNSYNKATLYKNEWSGIVE